jgi:hypothetical protein
MRGMAQMRARKGLTPRQPVTSITGAREPPLVDNFSIFLSHALLLIALWRLLQRPELDVEAPPEPDSEPEGFARRTRAAKKDKRHA